MSCVGLLDMRLVHCTEYKSYRMCLEACRGRFRVWVAGSDDTGMRILLTDNQTASWSSDFVLALMAAKVAIDTGQFA